MKILIYWKIDFMLLLIKYYKKYMQEKKIIITQNILKWTNQYKEDTDIYLNFLNECTKKSENHIRTSILYDAFKDWFVNNNPKTHIPSNKEFMINIKRHFNVTKIKDNGSVVNGIKNLKLNTEYVQ